nr:MAG TPA_asm: hypothetical protein [Caudoviricetes sp.]
MISPRDLLLKFLGLSLTRRRSSQKSGHMYSSTT